MNNLRQAVAYTLGAIEEGVSFDYLDNVTAPMLRRALAEQNKCTHGVIDGNCKECYMADEQEPVAWMYDCGNGGRMYAEGLDGVEGWMPLYLAPPQRKPLTEEEIEKAYRHIYRNVPDGSYRTTYYWIEQGIRYAEQAHGIGEKE